jgi:anti-sigma factor ChrR (cupin superfamily)
MKAHGEKAPVKSRMRLAIARLRAFLSQIVMTSEPHPPDIVLSAFAAGTLDEAQHDAIAAHVCGCACCRAFVRAMEHVGGIVLDGLPPTFLAAGSLAEVLARIEQFAPFSRSAAGACPLDRACTFSR